MALHKIKNVTPWHIYVSPTNNIWFWRNSISKMHHTLSVKMPNVS